jgi:hypothetical protein
LTSGAIGECERELRLIGAKGGVKAEREAKMKEVAVLVRATYPKP